MTQAHDMPEGEEAPPRGVWIMAALRWALVLGMAALAVVVGQRTGFWFPQSRQETAKQLYHCPMHTTYIAEAPGECPICHMTLVPIEANPPTAGATPHPQSVPGLVDVQIPAEQLRLIGVKTAKAERKPLSRTLDLVGYVVPDESKLAQVHTRISGWIQTLHVNETGQKVRKGDPLFTLFSKELVQAEREFVIGRKGTAGAAGDLGNMGKMARRRLELLDVPADEIDRLEKGGEPQDALLFRSPLSGYVLNKTAVEGKYVTPADELYQVADLGRVWVLAEVYESALALVEVGQKASLSVDAWPGKSFVGRVGFLYPTLSPRTRTLRVRLEFENPALELKPGMYGEVRLQLRAREALSVPEEAVVDAGRHQYAFVLKEAGRFEPRLLRLGMRAADRIEILSGLSEGEQVVTSAGFFIDSESRLQAAIGQEAP